MTDTPDPTRQQAGLTWGVRGSFVRYVTAAGRIEVTAPATPAGESAWHFPLTGYDTSVFRFAGSILFSAHHGLLTLTIIDPWLEFPRGIGSPGLLTAETKLSGPAGLERIRVADVTPSGATTLAEAGVALFDFHYPAGTPLAPLDAAGLSIFT